MAWGFRKSKKILPGVRLNLTKKGASVRLGGKGFGYTVGSSGKRATVGIPSTGLYFSKKLGGKSNEANEAPPEGWSWRWIFIGAILAFVITSALFQIFN